MRSVIHYALLTAMRDYLFVGLIAAFFIASLVSYFLGGTALVEQSEMITSYVAGSNRVILIAGMIIFISVQIKRLFDTKEIDVIITRPISRITFLLSYIIAFAIIAFILCLVAMIMLIIFTKSFNLSLAIWGISLFVEAIMVICFTLVASLILKSATSAILLASAFYCMSRMVGFFITMVKDTVQISDVSTLELFAKWFGEIIIKTTSIFFPRLDLFTKTSWLIYGSSVEEHFILIIMQAAIYIPLLIMLAIIDFSRKQF
jgi:ABC-type transport system involved in multi-copper enzyme maturation permease subunit